MTLKLIGVNGESKKSTKNFSNIDDSKTDVQLKSFALKYFAITDAAVKTAQKVVTTDVALA